MTDSIIVTKDPADLIWPDDFINKIICGDCLEVMKQIPDGAVDLVVTSPPYNMRTRIRNGEYTERGRCDADFSRKYAHFHDALSVEDYYQFHKRSLSNMLRITTNVFWNIQVVTGSKEAVFRLIGEFAKTLKDVMVWDKGHGQPAMHDNVLNRATELVLAFESPPTVGREFTNSYFKRGAFSDIIRSSRGGNHPSHRACFPVELPSMILQNWSQPGQIILDPFLGSGTTAVAAKQLGRKFIGIEISMDYCKIAEDRLRQEELF